MVDVYDPATWESGVKAVTGVAKLLDSLRKKLARGSGGDTREHLDALAGTVRNILDLMLEASHNETRAMNGIFEIMKDLNHRIGVLERAAFQKKPRKPSRRKPVKRKRRRT